VAQEHLLSESPTCTECFCCWLVGKSGCRKCVGCVGSGRQVAQGSKLYKEKGRLGRETEDDRILVKEVLAAKDESEAVAQLVESGAKQPFRCTTHCKIISQPLPQQLKLGTLL